MTLSPVEIARQVLEAGESGLAGKISEIEGRRNVARESLTDADIYRLGKQVLMDPFEDVLAAAKRAETLARAVQRYEQALREIAADKADHTHLDDGSAGCFCHSILALAALSPTAGDGRKEDTDAR